jgi:hypothetical protein
VRETLVRIKSANNLRRGASDKKTLEEAKIKFADVFVAATGNDSENIVACELAKLHKSQIRIRMKNVIFFNSKQFGIIPGEKSGGQERIHGEGYGHSSSASPDPP